MFKILASCNMYSMFVVIIDPFSPRKAYTYVLLRYIVSLCFFQLVTATVCFWSYFQMWDNPTCNSKKRGILTGHVNFRECYIHISYCFHLSKNEMQRKSDDLFFKTTNHTQNDTNNSMWDKFDHISPTWISRTKGICNSKLAECLEAAKPLKHINPLASLLYSKHHSQHSALHQRYCLQFSQLL